MDETSTWELAKLQNCRSPASPSLVVTDCSRMFVPRLSAASLCFVASTRSCAYIRLLGLSATQRLEVFFLILRCRLFLSLRRRSRKVSDCSPANRERELGLDRRETG